MGYLILFQSKVNLILFIFYIYEKNFFLILKEFLTEYFACIGYESPQMKEPKLISPFLSPHCFEF